jgi:hypothetical protein
MNTELAVVTEDGEVVEPASRAPMTLFGTDDPAAVVDRASAVATALAKVIKERKLSTKIGGKDHVQVEGWTLLGSMLGVFAEVEWSRPLENGWEARAVARTLAGNVVGAAEAMCTANEGRWRSADPYAVRSMAQTRAVSKALRLPLGFLMHLAGYSATPAEEVPEDQSDRSERASALGGVRSKPATTSGPARSPEEQTILDELLAIPGMTIARMSLLADAIGVEKGSRANADQLRAMLERATTPASGVPTVSPAGEVVARAASPIPTDDELLEAAGPGATMVDAGLQERIERAKAKGKAKEDEPSLAQQLGAPLE